ncbi:hypothetical protein [Clostridium saccharoperbutylacetonicum]|uniref:hypothetical protein n=1 Tax=Clostridium saccharoperbutylacetonicum TaxID=36745 RepID=UPI000983FEC7|nr:hypothetical protein [Clostridium saccharoperbutylacetonicum]AQR94723.1 hypothetical protein CLSAP_20370 [Clostridium saccharoperbutylacetonicum]NSB30564.1 hypothetical protein [Clostridium saccharoperbutylacetonicum]
MKQRIKRILTIGSIIGLMTSSVVPVSAADTSIKTQNLQSIKEKKNLPLEEAIAGAINNSDKLNLKSREIKMYEDKMRLQEKYNDYYNSINQKVYDYPYDKLELQEKQSKQAKEFMKDQIASDITNKYNDMVLKEIDLSKSKRALEFKRRDLEFINGKLSLEMATPTEVKDAQIELTSLENDIRAKEKLLNDNKEYFKVITDLDVKDTYKLDYSMNYEKFKITGSVDEYIDDKIDTYLNYDNKIFKLSKDYMKKLKEDGIKDIMSKTPETLPDRTSNITVKADGTTEFDAGSYALRLIDYQKKQQEYLAKLNAYEEYIDGQYSVDEAKVNIDEAKKNLKNAMKESYSTLLALEDKINNLKEQETSVNTKLSFTKAQVDMGLMLQNDYDKQVLESEALDTGIRKLVYTYNNLKDNIQKPWILSSK